jgi:hypothetical protein
VVTRAISTVLDVTVCLLLISAAVGTLLMSDPAPVDGTADATAEQLAVTTANVSDSGGAVSRTAYGTHAELLARAVVTNLTVSGRPVTPTTGAFRETVRERIGRLLDRAPSRTSVSARFQPYRDSPVEGRLTVGPAPPDRAVVSTARLSVPLPVSDRWTESTDSFDGLARALSGVILEYTLGATAGPSEPSNRFDKRSRAFDRALDSPSPEARRRALTARFSRDFRDRFDSPTAAAEALRPDVVRVVVREWEA